LVFEKNAIFWPKIEIYVPQMPIVWLGYFGQSYENYTTSTNFCPTVFQRKRYVHINVVQKCDWLQFGRIFPKNYLVTLDWSPVSFPPPYPLSKLRRGCARGHSRQTAGVNVMITISGDFAYFRRFSPICGDFRLHIWGDIRLFVAIFAYLRRKNGVLDKKRCYDKIWAKTSRHYKQEMSIFWRKYF
jgi:hypothetical protein